MRLAALSDPETGFLEVSDGERVVLLGGSGSGKTVVVRKLLALGQRVTGRSRTPVPQSVAYVPQTDGALLDLRVLQHLCAPHPGVPGIPEDKARDWLDLVGLSSHIDRPTSELSLAERRRVALARALSRERPLLVVDGDLDPSLNPLLSDLLDVVPHLCSVLTTSCTATDWVRRADRIAVVHDCRVIATGTWEQLVGVEDDRVQVCLAWTMP